MSENEICTLLFYILLGLAALWNASRFKEFKSLKLENELLKFKIKECEQRRTQPTDEKC